MKIDEGQKDKDTLSKAATSIKEIDAGVVELKSMMDEVIQLRKQHKETTKQSQLDKCLNDDIASVVGDIKKTLQEEKEELICKDEALKESEADHTDREKQ